MLPDENSGAYDNPQPGYRFLHIGEVLEVDDEYWHTGKGPWKPATIALAGRSVQSYNVPFRRKLSDEIVI
jgi:hypothetical protein